MKSRGSPGSTLAIGVLATCFVARPLVVAGAPSVVKFLHFGLVALSTGLMAPRITGKASRRLARGLILLAFVIIASALANGAGAINVLLDFALLSEPLLLLMLLTATPDEALTVESTRRWVYGLGGVHVALAIFQYFVQGLHADDVKGVFLDQGAGHHVGGAVAMTLCAAALFGRSRLPMIIRCLAAIASLAVVFFSDSKQVLAVFIVSLGIFAALNSRRLGTALKILSAGAVSVAGIVVAGQTIYPALLVWAKPDVLSQAIPHKFSVFSLLAAHGEHWWQLLVGMGPGHTVGRLALLLPEYWSALSPLGATTSPVTTLIYHANDSNWMSNSTTGSSMWALTFFWAGLLGDLGLIGTGVFLWLWMIAWKDVCRDNLSRFFVVNVLVFGIVFAWLEEPGYMLFVTAMLGIGWQDSVAALAARRMARDEFEIGTRAPLVARRPVRPLEVSRPVS